MISVYLLLDSALAVFLFVVRLQNGFISRHTTQALSASTNGATRLVIAFSCCALCLKKRKH